MCDVVERAELVGQGVVDSQEGVGKCHTCQAGCVGHMVAGRDVRAVCISGRQVVKYELGRLERCAFREVGCQHGDIGLDRVRHDVDTGSGCQALGLCHHVVGINNGHIRKELIVGQRILDARVAVRDDSERCDLGACTGGGRDCYEIGFLSHLRIHVDTLPDVHEVHGHVGEVGIRVLIEHPHDLGRVHCGAAAERDDDVRLKCPHLGRAFQGVLQCRVGLYIGEACVDDSHGVELLLDRLRVAVLVKECVRYDERAFFVHDRAELVESDRHAALLEIDLFRCAEPKHIFSPLCNGLDIDEVQRAYIVGNGISAVGAAAQGQGRKEREVIDVADAALRGWCVDQDAACLHAVSMGCHFLLLGRVDIEGSRVAEAAVADELVCLVEGLLEAVSPVHGKDR